GDIDALAFVSSRIGNTLVNLENYDEAIKYYEDAYAYYMADNNSSRAGAMQSNKGRAYVLSGNAEQAIETLRFNTLLRFKQDMSDRSVGIAFFQLGHAYKQLGQTREALASYDSARHYFVLSKIPSRLAGAYEELAIAYEKLNDFEKALWFQKLFHDLTEEIQNDPNRDLVIQLQNRYEIAKAEEASASAIAKVDELNASLVSEENNRITWALGGAAFAMMIVVLVLVLQRQAFVQNLLVRLKIKN
ncbi:MAG: tetratricopeptide repeat protein, partial [Bacteroidota bacterium]